MKRHVTICKISVLFVPTIRIACTLLLILPFSISTSAEIYRWIDAQGKTHFSEHPPGVYFTDNNGKEYSVSEEERQGRVSRLEQEIRRHCS